MCSLPEGGGEVGCVREDGRHQAQVQGVVPVQVDTFWESLVASAPPLRKSMNLGGRAGLLKAQCSVGAKQNSSKKYKIEINAYNNKKIKSKENKTNGLQGVCQVIRPAWLLPDPACFTVLENDSFPAATAPLHSSSLSTTYLSTLPPSSSCRR